MPEVQPVWILLVEVGRKKGDGLPERATGAAFLCYTAARDEKNAVDETVNVLRQAGLNPLEVESYGNDADPQGFEVGEEERALMERARAENAVIVASVEHFTEEGG